MRLANITWPKAQKYFKENDMVLLGIGSIECHGRHMPLGTDTLIPNKLLELIEKKSDVLIAPTLPYGACESLKPYPGTIDLGSELLYQLLSYPNKIFTRLQLLEEIWGPASDSMEATVSVHINRLRKRFEQNPDFEIITIRGLGYKAQILEETL